jgi:hypothetical protein
MVGRKTRRAYAVVVWKFFSVGRYVNSFRKDCRIAIFFRVSAELGDSVRWMR